MTSAITNIMAGSLAAAAVAVAMIVIFLALPGKRPLPVAAGLGP